MSMTSLHNISQEFNTDYVRNWPFLAVYLREMEECWSRLTKAIQDDNTLAARAELHQMLGGTRILNYVGLEEKLVLLQSIVKSAKPSKEGIYLLTDIKVLLDELFEYLMEARRNYDFHLLAKSGRALSMLKDILHNEVQLSGSSSSSMEEYKSWESDNETDLIIIDAEQNTKLLDGLTEQMLSSFDETPVLLFSDSVDTKGITFFPNISGQLKTSSDASQWIAAIQTVVNGRAYWPKK